MIFADIIYDTCKLLQKRWCSILFGVITNVFLFAAYVLILIVEFVFMKIFRMNYNTPWLITTLAYIMFIAYQILARTNEYMEKGKVKEIIYSIMDAVNGIPLVNKDGKIVIQWDIIFKKLIDKKLYLLYDNIIKTKTKTIDHYVNQYPSILLNSSTDMIERNSKIDTKSTITINNKNEKVKEEIKELDLTQEIMSKLFIKYISYNKITIANFDSSINIDFILNEEFEPQDYEKYRVKPDKRYDGFSVIAYYKDQKFYIVPRTMVFAKRIDKEKWLYQNIKKIMDCAENIANGIPEYGIVVDDLSLKDVLYDYIEDDSGKIPELHFEYVDDNLLIFSGADKKGKESVRAYCTLETRHNGFEIKLVKYELIIDDVSEVIEDDKTIVIGNTYQPLITIMENMKKITRNIRVVISKKDIEDLVIK